SLPAWLRIGTESGMHHGNRRAIVLILQVCKKGTQLPHQKHSLVDNGTAGERSHISPDAALFKLPAHNVESPVKSNAFLLILWFLDKRLLNIRHTGSCTVAENFRHSGNLSPSQKTEAFFLHNRLEHLLRLISFQLILGEKKHSNSIL